MDIPRLLRFPLVFGLIVAAFLCSIGAARGATVVVRPGDTLAAIAAQVGTTPETLARLNGLADPNHVVAGARLRTTAPTSTAQVAGGSGSTHTVRAGETLASIAAARGTTVAALARVNGIKNPNLVVAGSRLRLGGATPSASGTTTSPSAGSRYTVRSGDTLAAIGVRLGTTPEALARANGIADPNLIVVGTTLRGTSTPAGVPASAPAPSRSGIAPLLDAAAARHGVSSSLVRAVAWQESGWNQAAVSSAGALGVMQLMPATATWAGPSLLGRSINPSIASDNIDAGVAFLAHLITATGHVPTALAAYNQGLASVRKRGLFNETQRYVASVQSLVGTV